MVYYYKTAVCKLQGSSLPCSGLYMPAYVMFSPSSTWWRLSNLFPAVLFSVFQSHSWPDEPRRPLPSSLSVIRSVAWQTAFFVCSVFHCRWLVEQFFVLFQLFQCVRTRSCWWWSLGLFSPKWQVQSTRDTAMVRSSLSTARPNTFSLHEQKRTRSSVN